MRFLLIFTFLFYGFTTPSYSEEVIRLKAYTAHLPPFSMDPKSKNPGFSFEIVKEMSQRANIELDIIYLPWKRSQLTAMKTPNSLVFGMSRTSRREPNYAWVVKLIDSNYAFMSTKKKINTYGEAKKLKDISAMLETPREKILKAKKFENLTTIKDIEKVVTRLHRGRTDAWFTLTHRAAYMWRKNGYPESELIIGKSLKVTHNWLGANKSISKSIIERFNKAMASMKSDGTYNKIYEKYFGKFSL